MKRSFLSLAAAAALLMPALTSCSDDPEVPNPDKPTYSSGVYVLNQGNYYKSIDGSLNFIDYDSGEITDGVFKKANGRLLGDTPQCGLVYGSKLYIGVYQSSTVEIADRNTLKSLKQIKCEGRAKQPRSMAATGGYVYISMYDGNVARLDTATLTIDKTLEVGPNPENIAIHNGKIWVPNSDGMNYAVGYGRTASIIDIASFTVEATVEVPLNPDKFLSEAGHLFLLAKGDYGSVKSLLYEIDDNIAEIQKDPSKKEEAWKEIGPATMVCSGNGSIYMIDSPFNEDGILIDCRRYDIATSSLKGWIPEGLDYPSGLGVDPLTGDIFVASYRMDGKWPSYDAPCILLQYGCDGRFKKRYDIGSGPAAIFFDTK